MEFKKEGFTLIELLLGVTLSAILMTGIVVFISSSLGSNMATKKMLEETNKNERFDQRFTEVLENITGSGIYPTGTVFGGDYLTGIFLSTGGPNMPITFIGLKTATGYCDSYSGTESETGTVMKLAMRQFIVPTVQNSTSYTLSLTGNSIFSGTTRIIGTGYPGSDLDTTSGSLTELSSPSSLISSGTQLYIADTMNDRVLSYNITSGTISEVLGPESGIRKPNSLYFSGAALLIASSGNGKIYSLEDGEGDGSIFSSTFQIANNFSANELKFTFSGITFTSPPPIGSFTLSGYSQNPTDIVSTGSNLLIYSGALQSFLTGSIYKFTIDNILPLPSTPGNHVVTIDFLSGSTPVYSDTFHYYTKGDGNIVSSTGNILKTLSGGFFYPHNITGPTTWSGTIDWSTILLNPPEDETLSALPIQDLTFQVAGKILTIQYHEYRKYDCILGKHQIEEKIQKVLLP